MKAIQQTVRLLIITAMIMAAAAIYSCTENQSGGKGNVGVAQNKGSGDDFITVTGVKHYSADILTSPLMRNSLREYCYSMTMLEKAREAKIEVSDEDINTRIEETKEVVDQRNTTWEHYLESQYLTEEEYWLNTKYTIMFERLVEGRVEVTEEDKLELWDTQQQSIIDQYLSENHLPESERSSVEYDMVADICEERAINILKQSSLIDVRTEIVNDCTLQMNLLADADERQLFEDLILNMAREAQEGRADSAAMPGTAQ